MMRKLKINHFGSAAVALMLSMQTANADNIRFWTTEEQPDRLAKQEKMAADFKGNRLVRTETKSGRKKKWFSFEEAQGYA